MNYDGFINLNKDKGYSSQYAVAAVKRLLHVKAGHCGTLDPQAEGVLPICLGKATRLSGLVMGRPKTYIGEICFGEATSSYDAAGDITDIADASHLTAAMVEDVLPKFIGAIAQIPPAISALKQGGVPLYKRARRGEKLDLKARPVMIYDIRLLSFTPGVKAYAKIEVECGQGAYIRSLAFDIGRALQLPAHLSALQRTRTGEFVLSNTYTIQQIQDMAEAGDLSFILPMNEVVDFIPQLVVNEKQKNKISHGHSIIAPTEFNEGEQVRLVNNSHDLLALGTVVKDNDKKIIKMDKVFIEPQANLACAIGNFDGLHLGHKALFTVLKQQKRAIGSKSAVLTFEPHPLAIIKGQAPQMITGAKLKDELLTEYFAIDKVMTYEFTHEVMNSTPEEFVDKIIVNQVKPQHVVVGYNFTFGIDGRGTASVLRSLCQDKGIDVTIVGEIDSQYGPVSSSNIRKYLADGNLEAVNEMLGYWFVIEGEVIYGNQLGRSIGYPTANCHTEINQAVPQNGVYATRIEHNGVTYDGVTNFGFKPTIGGETKPLMEAHLFDTDLDLYGETIRVWFGKFLRPERKFASISELTAQINTDSIAARQFLSTVPPNKHLPSIE